jgi:NADH-quinone oxidoreductase subunit H
MKFAFFFLAEYAYVTVGSLLGATVFLGGGTPPVAALGFIPSWAWLLGKSLALMFVFLWVRWTMPRIRVDRVMDLCWKFFVPWTLISILGWGGWLVWSAR